jgi:hypothetical protein
VRELQRKAVVIRTVDGIRSRSTADDALVCVVSTALRAAGLEATMRSTPSG